MTENNEATYTLWHVGVLQWQGPHTRETLDEMLEWAFESDGKSEIFSSRDDLVWASYGPMSDNEDLMLID